MSVLPNLCIPRSVEIHVQCQFVIVVLNGIIMGMVGKRPKTDVQNTRNISTLLSTLKNRSTFCPRIAISAVPREKRVFREVPW